MKKYLWDMFKTTYNLQQFLDKVFGCDNYFGGLFSSEHTQIIEYCLKENYIEITKYDFISPYPLNNFCVANLESTIKYLPFRGRPTQNISDLRKTAVLILSNKEKTLSGEMIIEDSFRIVSKNCIVIESKKVIAICGAIDSLRFFKMISDYKKEFR